jgi:RNA-splicing ligase RtcB
MKLKGAYTDASVFAETIDSETLTQIRLIINQKFMENSKVSIMPDAHAGAGVCIGFTATLGEYVVPNFIGVDIGCGVASQQVQGNMDFQELDTVIRKYIPHGMNNNKSSNEGEICQAIKEIGDCPSDILLSIGEVANRVYGEAGANEEL